MGIEEAIDTATPYCSSGPARSLGDGSDALNIMGESIHVFGEDMVPGMLMVVVHSASMSKQRAQSVCLSRSQRSFLVRHRSQAERLETDMAVTNLVRQGGFLL